jgi:hypothetical protein
VQEKDVATLNLMQDVIVNTYRPFDIILIAMKPSSICIGRHDFVENSFPFSIFFVPKIFLLIFPCFDRELFIREFFKRSFLQAALFSYFPVGFNSLHGLTDSYE